MTTSAELKKIVTMARPLIEQAIDLTDEFAALRQAATDKGIDWNPLKALLKAQIQDERDNGNRVAKLIERADHSASYASLLGVGQNNFISAPTQNPAPDAKTVAPAPANTEPLKTHTAPVSAAPAGDDGGIPDFLRRAPVSA